MLDMRSSPLLRYGIAALALAAATLLRLLLEPVLGNYAPFVTFFGASMLIAWFGGLAPALLTMFGGALIADYLFIPPRGELWPAQAFHWVAIGLFLSINLVVILLADATRRSRVRAESSERHFRRLLEAGNVGIGLVDQRGGVQYANPALLSLLGYSAEEVQAGKLRWDRITPPELLPVTERVIRRVEETGAALSYEPYEKEYIAKDGRRIPVLVNLVPFERQADGTGTGAIFVMDLSRIRRAEAALRTNEERLRVAARTAAFGSFDINLLTGEEFWSPELKALFGLPPDAPVELDADGLPIYIHPDDRERVRRTILDSVNPAGTGDMEAEHRLLRSDGSVRWVMNRSKVLFAGEGEHRLPVRRIGALIDITERKRAEEELVRLNRRLRENEAYLRRANAELQQFAYVVSHDLKAPLRAVYNLSSWIEEELGESLSADGRNLLRLLHERVRLMDALIDGLLDYSRAGRISRIEEVATSDLVRDVVRAYPLPPEFSVVIPPDMPCFATDRVHLQQVFANLIGNAIKYHDRPDGHVWVAARDQGDFYEFSVADDGPGIPPEYHERIFQMLQRGPEASKSGGTGIGLAVVKRVVEHLGGCIQLESAPGQGSTFRFTWPKAIPAEAVEKG